MNKLETWLKSLLAAAIGGTANTILLSLGVSVANAAGAGVKPLDWSQIKAVAISGAFLSVLMYLKQSPIPPLDDSVAAASSKSGFISVKQLLLVFSLAAMAIGLVACFSGCAALSKGADPLVVRTEQAETDGKAAFDLVLDVDNSNRGFFRTNAPGFHAFCEGLRVPVTVDLTNTLPTASAYLQSLDDVKVAYQNAKATSNALATAILTLEAVVNQAMNWEAALTAITNTPTARPAAVAVALKPALQTDAALAKAAAAK